MANPFPFVANTVLTAAELNGIGEATTYTPTFTNLSIGNGTSSFKFTRVNNNILLLGSIIFGSTTSVTGLINITFPISADTTVNTGVIGIASAQDSGVGTFPLAIFQESTTLLRLFAIGSASTYLGPLTATSSTVPFTWANTDEIRLMVMYKAA